MSMEMDATSDGDGSECQQRGPKNVRYDGGYCWWRQSKVEVEGREEVRWRTVSVETSANPRSCVSEQ